MSFDVPSEFQEKFEKMWRVGQVTRHCLDELDRFVKAGITTLQIDEYVRGYAHHRDLICATIGYKGFPAACCVSTNHVMCHGIPDVKVLKETDIVNVDVTFILDGYYGDASRTWAFSRASVKANKLLKIAHEAMWEGIKLAKAGTKLRVMAEAIQKCVEDNGFSVARDFVGHGIGTGFHMPPSIPNQTYDFNPDLELELTPGMTFTVEPIVNAGKPFHKLLNDEWSVVTRDRSLSAQFEHTIGVTNSGDPVVFTL